MWINRKMKLYQVTWNYDSTDKTTYTDLVRAYDVAHAWSIIKKEHGVPISLISVKTEETE